MYRDSLDVYLKLAGRLIENKMLRVDISTCQVHVTFLFGRYVDIVEGRPAAQ
jgi:hypothetical protein